MAPDERLIEDAVAAQIHAADPQTRLAAADFHDVLTEMQENVVSVMNRAGRDVMIDQDYAFIQRYVGKMVGLMLAKVETKLRFQKGDRVMCNVGGERRWASGTVQAVNERDPEDPTGRTVVAYVVKVDPPDARLVSAPRDSDELIFTECCFGQRADALWFTLLAMPLRSLKTRRFALGERVACAETPPTGTVHATSPPSPRATSHPLATSPPPSHMVPSAPTRCTSPRSIHPRTWHNIT